MSSSRTLLGFLVTTGVLSLGHPALMGYTLNQPDYRQGATVLTAAPPSVGQDVFFTSSGDGGRDRPSDMYSVRKNAPTADDSPSSQSTWVPTPSPTRDRNGGRDH